MQYMGGLFPMSHFVRFLVYLPPPSPPLSTTDWVQFLCSSRDKRDELFNFYHYEILAIRT